LVVTLNEKDESLSQLYPFKMVIIHLILHPLSKKKGVLQYPLSDKKGSVFYPMAEPLKNGSVQKKWFCKK
jgi:hypothetical protein